MYGLLAVSFVPFVLLTPFVRPSTDDYCFAMFVQQQGYWSFQKTFYQTWSGRYTGNLIMSSNPMVWEAWGLYCLAAALTLGGVLAMLYGLARRLTFGTLPVLQTLLLAALLWFGLMAQFPSIPHYFYWYTGHLYTFGDYLTVGWLMALSRYETTDDPARRRRAYTWLLVLPPLITGCNEISLVLFMAMLTALIFFKTLHHRRLPWGLLGAWLAGAVGAGFALLSPGNSTRTASELYAGARKHDLLFTLTNAPKTAYNFFLEFFLGVLIVSLATLPLWAAALDRMTDRQRRFFHVPPLYLLLTWAGLLLLGMLPMYWAVGTAPTPLPRGVMYTWLLLGWVYILIVLLEARRQRQGLHFSFIQQQGLLLVLAVVFLSSYNYRSMLSDLLSGRAYRYAREMDARVALLRGNTPEPIRVPYIRNQPVTILPHSPIAEDHAFDFPRQINTCARDYFGKKIIPVKE